MSGYAEGEKSENSNYQTKKLEGQKKIQHKNVSQAYLFFYRELLSCRLSDKTIPHSVLLSAIKYVPFWFSQVSPKTNEGKKQFSPVFYSSRTTFLTQRRGVYEINESKYILTSDRPATDRPTTDLSLRKFQMAISPQRVVRSTSCLVLGWGFRGRRI